MKTKNRTQLIGYVGKEPAIRECKNGRKLAVLRLATDHRIKSEGDKKYKPTWHNIAIWGDLVEQLGNITTGSHILVEGRIEYQSYLDKNGQRRYVTEINTHSFTDLDR